MTVCGVPAGRRTDEAGLLVALTAVGALAGAFAMGAWFAR